MTWWQRSIAFIAWPAIFAALCGFWLVAGVVIWIAIPFWSVAGAVEQEDED